MVRCFKMVALDVLLSHDALFAGLPIAHLAELSHAWICLSSGLFRDIAKIRALPDPRDPNTSFWLRYWPENPIAAWTSGPWFRVEAHSVAGSSEGHVDGADWFVRNTPYSSSPDLNETFVAMLSELVTLRVAPYRARGRTGDLGPRNPDES